MKLILKLIESPGEEILGSTKVLTEEGGSIGRLPTCFWQLKDESCSLSREHARIFIQNNQFYIEDNSTNGVFLNASVMELGRGVSCQLNINDTINMGDYTFYVESIELEQTMSDGPDIPLYHHLDTVLPTEHLDKNDDVIFIEHANNDPLLELFDQDSSLMNAETGSKDHIEEPLGINSSEHFMAELTGDGKDLEFNLTNQRCPDQELDSHDIVMDGAFTMPETIPDPFGIAADVSLTGEPGNIENDSLKSATIEQSDPNPSANIIPDGFIPDLSEPDVPFNTNGVSVNQSSFVDNLAEKSTHENLIVDAASENIIPDNYIPDKHIPGNHTPNDYIPGENLSNNQTSSQCISDGMEDANRIPEHYVPDLSGDETFVPGVLAEESIELLKDTHTDAINNLEMESEALDHARIIQYLQNKYSGKDGDLDMDSMLLSIQQSKHSLQILIDGLNNINETIENLIPIHDLSEMANEYRQLLNFKGQFEGNAEKRMDNSALLNQLFKNIELCLVILNKKNQ